MSRFKATEDGNVPFTPEEEQEWDARELAWNAGARDRLAAEIKTERNKKLYLSDWRVIKSLESNQLQDFAWVAYRQALRDMPEQAGFPDNVVWPVEP